MIGNTQAEITRLTIERDAWHSECVATQAELARARDRFARALADIEKTRPWLVGRKAPTDAEIDAHAAAGGMCVLGVDTCMWVFLATHTQQAKNMREGVMDAQTWYAFDAKARPCIGPVLA